MRSSKRGRSLRGHARLSLRKTEVDARHSASLVHVGCEVGWEDRPAACLWPE
jgi:hypothetical protein